MIIKKEKIVKRGRSLLPSIPPNYLKEKQRTEMQKIINIHNELASTKRNNKKLINRPVQIDDITYKLVKNMKIENDMFVRDIIFESVLLMKYVLDSQETKRD